MALVDNDMTVLGNASMDMYAKCGMFGTAKEVLNLLYHHRWLFYDVANFMEMLMWQKKLAYFLHGGWTMHLADLDNGMASLYFLCL